MVVYNTYLFLQLWAFEPFHGLVLEYVTDHSSTDRELPLILYWSNALLDKDNTKDAVDDYVPMVNDLEVISLLTSLIEVLIAYFSFFFFFFLVLPDQSEIPG